MPVGYRVVLPTAPVMTPTPTETTLTGSDTTGDQTLSRVLYAGEFMAVRTDGTAHDLRRLIRLVFRIPCVNIVQNIRNTPYSTGMIY